MADQALFLASFQILLISTMDAFPYQANRTNKSKEKGLNASTLRVTTPKYQLGNNALNKLNLTAFDNKGTSNSMLNQTQSIPNADIKYQNTTLKMQTMLKTNASRLKQHSMGLSTLKTFNESLASQKAHNESEYELKTGLKSWKMLQTNDTTQHGPKIQKTSQTTLQLPTTCPEERTFDIDYTRYPQIIEKVQCNGYGTTCLAVDGTLACKEVTKTMKIYRLLGVDSQGKSVYRQESYTVASGCTCGAS